MWNGAVRFLSFCAPVLGVGIWGGIYLVDCAQTLLSPGTGFQIDIETPGGTLDATCKSYSYNPIMGVLTARDFKLSDPAGKPIVDVSQAVIQGLRLDGSIAPKVAIKKGYLRLERDAQGKFDFQKYLPESKGEESEITYEVEVESGQIDFIDYASKSKQSNRLYIKSARLAGRGQDIQGATNVQLDQMFRADVQFQKSGKKLSLQLPNFRASLNQMRNRLELGPERKYLKDLKELRTANVNVSGSLVATYSDRPALTGQIKIEGEELQWQKYPKVNISGSGRITEKAFDGTIKGTFGTANETQIDWKGIVGFQPKIASTGRFKLANLRPSIAKTFKVDLPKEFKIQSADIEGEYHFDQNRPRVVAAVFPRGMQLLGQPISVSRVEANYDGRKASLVVRNSRVGTAPIDQIYLGVDVPTLRWSASASLSNIRSSDFRKYLPEFVGKSTGSLKLIAQGQSNRHQRVLLSGRVNPEFRLGDQWLRFQNVQVGAHLEKDRLIVDRILLDEEKANLAVQGWIDFKQNFNFSLFTSKLNLANFSKDASGTADVQLNVSGSVKQPKVTGKFAGFDLGLSGVDGKLSALTARIETVGNQIFAKEILALRGTGQLKGEVGYDLKKSVVDGTLEAQGFTIADFFEGPLSGAVDAPVIRLKGPIEKLKLSGEIQARSLVAKLDDEPKDVAKTGIGVEMNPRNAQLKFTFEDSKVSLSEGSFDLGGGKIDQITGQLDLEKKDGSLSARFEKLKFNELLNKIRTLKQVDGQLVRRVVGDSIFVEGTSSGSAEVGFKSGELSSSKVKATLDNISFNRSFFGSGDLDVELLNQEWKANALLGSLNDYLRIDDFAFSPQSQTIRGELVGFNVPIRAFLDAARPKFSESPEMFEKVRLLNGNLGLYAKLNGTLENPEVDLEELQVDALQLGKENLGSLSANASYRKGELNVRSATLVGPKIQSVVLPFVGRVQIPPDKQVPDGIFRLTGTSQDFQTIDAKVAASGFHVSKFSALAPILASINLDVKNAELTVKGKLEQPVITGKLSGSANFQQLSPTNKILSERLKIEGTVAAVPNASGFEVSLDSKAQFWTLNGFAKGRVLVDREFRPIIDEPVDAVVGLEGTCSLNPFLETFKKIQTGEEGGSIQGQIRLTDRWKSPKLSGGFQVNLDGAKVTGIQPVIGKPIDAGLKDLQLKVGFAEINQQTNLVVDARGASSQSPIEAGNFSQGYANFHAELPLDKWITGNADPALLTREPIVNGSFSINNFKVIQTFPDNAFMEAEISTPKPLRLAGTLESPLITGEIGLSGVKTVVPAVTPVESSGQASSFNPQFDLTVRLLNPAKINTSGAEIFARGSATFKGKLDRLVANGLFQVDSGELALPGARVKLVPDGTVKFSYSGDQFSPTASLIANMKGETALTTLKNGNTPERYEITLDVNGDLLDPAGVNLTASSVPGDLPQDRILQLLGRTDLLGSVLQPGSNSNLEEELRNAVTAFALPSLLGGVTNNLARGLGLEYVSVDYNALEQLSLSFAKSIGNGFFLQGRRQLSAPLPGLPQSYDIRFAFRPRRGPNALRNLSFSVGTDQFLPYKFAMDYSARVRVQKPGYREIKLNVPK